MSLKKVNKANVDRIYTVGLIFCSIIFLDVLLYIGLLLKTYIYPIKQNNACESIDKEKAISLVMKRTEVQDFEQLSVENGNKMQLSITSLGDTWTVQVYASVSGEIQEFNQYTFDNCGLLRCSKKLYYGTQYIRNFQPNEFPCAERYDTTQKNK